ncbi:MAG: hypothetical protein LBD46_02310 [Endomicrobium sp.]|jgi:hypothetical protein|nr:hypothetical protein [Endomicrobium sp.]
MKKLFSLFLISIFTFSCTTAANILSNNTDKAAFSGGGGGGFEGKPPY